MLGAGKLTETIPEFQARLASEVNTQPPTRTITVVNVTREPLPIEAELGLNRHVREYQSEVTETALGLMALTGMSEEESRSVAYAIVSEDVPEVWTQRSLHALTRPTELELGAQTMRMLDGGIHLLNNRD